VIDEPVQYFFTTKFTETTFRSSHAHANSQRYLDSFTKYAFGELKVHMFPQAEKNTILIRLSNIADLFDKQYPSPDPYFDLLGYAQALYTEANPGLKPGSVRITERTLSNSMDFKKMKKFNWKV
jgi:hypothetical protein